MAKKFRLEKLAANVFCLSLLLVSVARAEDVERLKAEVLNLRLRLQQTQAEILNAAQFSPHGYLDPRVQALGVYARQVEQQLSASARRLAQHEANSLHGDLKRQLESISADLSVGTEMNPITQKVTRQVDPSSLRVQIGGTEYFLVPVHTPNRGPSSADGVTDAARKRRRRSQSGVVK